jgi:CsoR family transcriptional regulator, copper-sensing transcriptional repressor
MKKELKPKVLAQLNRAEGMLKKVISMVEEDKYCIDVLQQSLAVIGFAKSANRLLLENHLDSCFKVAMKSSSPKKQKEMIDELLQIVSKI